ncbi:PQQ-dependent sugar dehydrogenase [Nocardioides sp. Kera G14]|uniref:PQQ-dependent sugar dehydrogenase n=1 Tax=Nocardioides sp. Kera G14 TaxID=2884264 RepID=UPI001D119EAD|nr:PQQ-dependent sugar dehydrogenase [Nocardioides sp. Kera G14]UDY24916.1 PQQ-dependent sugar dehydrogenase [Nocardioides sp. Kera G14]
MCRLLALLLLGSLVVVLPGGPADASAPRLSVRVVASGLDHPWDVATLPGRRGLLVTERTRARLDLVRSGHRHAVRLRGARIWTNGETGLLGLEVDPGFRKNRRIYTCQGWRTAGGHDVRVVAWKLSKRLTSARPVRTLVAGLPSRSGRHGGCRLLIARDGSLLVGTGDAATGTNPHSLTSLGGKVLRLNRMTGAPAKGNPFLSSSNARTRLIYTWGHRNVQGLAQRSNGTLWSVEQGTSRDDEVNLLTPGGDYGYNPVPGYNESVPMTDQSLPGTQIAARWSSGRSTIATSGATFVPNTKKWGAYAGALAVGVLKGTELMLLRFDAHGRLVARSNVLTTYGRIRTAAVDRQGNLLVTTDNGDGRDVLLRVTPHR